MKILSSLWGVLAATVGISISGYAQKIDQPFPMSYPVEHRASVRAWVQGIKAEDAWSYYHLGKYGIENGERSDFDPEAHFKEPLAYVVHAAGNDLLEAQLYLGKIYSHGFFLGSQRILPDIAEALKWYGKAAEHGCLKAKEKIETLKALQIPQKQSGPEAKLLASADQGDPESQYLVGEHYLKHQDDRLTAMQYFGKAASQGHDRAAVYRSRLCKSETEAVLWLMPLEAQFKGIALTLGQLSLSEERDSHAREVIAMMACECTLPQALSTVMPLITRPKLLAQRPKSAYELARVARLSMEGNSMRDLAKKGNRKAQKAYGLGYRSSFIVSLFKENLADLADLRAQPAWLKGIAKIVASSLKPLARAKNDEVMLTLSLFRFVNELFASPAKIPLLKEATSLTEGLQAHFSRALESWEQIKQFANQGYIYAQVGLGWGWLLCDNTYQQGIILLKEIAERKWGDIYGLLGEFLEPSSVQKALECYSLGVTKQNVKAMMGLGRLYMDPQNWPQKRPQGAVHPLQEAAQCLQQVIDITDQPEAYILLGHIYRHKEPWMTKSGIPQDLERACTLYETAIQKGGMLEEGIMDYFAEPRQDTYWGAASTHAVRLLEQLYERCETRREIISAALMTHWRKSPNLIDPQKAAIYGQHALNHWKQLALEDDIDGYTRLLDLLLYGPPELRNPVEELKWALKATEKTLPVPSLPIIIGGKFYNSLVERIKKVQQNPSDVGAIHDITNLYVREGNSFYDQANAMADPKEKALLENKRNEYHKKMLEWAEKGAELGECYCQVRAGFAYRGLDILNLKDNAKVAHFLQMAVHNPGKHHLAYWEKGDSEWNQVYYWLAWAYHSGLGVEKDINKACELYKQVKEVMKPANFEEGGWKYLTEFTAFFYAQRQLAEIHLNEAGHIDLEKAYQYFKRPFEMGAVGMTGILQQLESRGISLDMTWTEKMERQRRRVTKSMGKDPKISKYISDQLFEP